MLEDSREGSSKNPLSNTTHLVTAWGIRSSASSSDRSASRVGSTYAGGTVATGTTNPLLPPALGARSVQGVKGGGDTPEGEAPARCNGNVQHHKSTHGIKICGVESCYR
jgi:hypothetical protein